MNNYQDLKDFFANYPSVSKIHFHDRPDEFFNTTCVSETGAVVVQSGEMIDELMDCQQTFFDIIGEVVAAHVDEEDGSRYYTDFKGECLIEDGVIVLRNNSLNHETEDFILG